MWKEDLKAAYSQVSKPVFSCPTPCMLPDVRGRGAFGGVSAPPHSQLSKLSLSISVPVLSHHGGLRFLELM
jgi:hypothetical protein